VGLFDFLTGGKGGNVQKIVARANNKHAQSVDRFRALEQLREDGSDEALVGLLRRFTFNYDKSIEDEQEKDWVHDALVETASEEERKPTVVRALERALLESDTIAYPLKVLAHVATPDETWPLLEKLIAQNDNQYVRDPSKKIQLIDFLGEASADPRVPQALLQYLEDMDEGVRFHTVEALLHQKNEELAREPLLKLLTSKDEESRRIKIRILDGLADAGWNTHGYKGSVEQEIESLGLGHGVDNKGRIKKPQR
jgi:hypothetical protein